MNVVESARLTLRRMDLEDAPFVLRLLNEPGFLRFIGDKGVRNLADARDYLSKGPLESYHRYGFGLYLVSLRCSGTQIGVCGLVKRDGLADPDIGFAFLEVHWSRGYAVESSAAVLEYGRTTLGLGRIVAITAPENHASRAVLEKIGLRFEGIARLTEGGGDLHLFGPADQTVL